MPYLTEEEKKDWMKLVVQLNEDDGETGAVMDDIYTYRLLRNQLYEVQNKVDFFMWIKNVENHDLFSGDKSLTWRCIKSLVKPR